MSYFRTFFALGLSLLLVMPAHAVTLKIATLSPEGTGWMKVLRKSAANVEARTGGAVKFKFYPGGVMGDDKAVLRKMRIGQLHGAVLTSGGLVQNYKDISLYSLPMLFRNEAEVDYVRQAMDAELMAGLRKNKFVGFGFAEVGFAYPMMQQPATAVAQLRSRKVWTPDNDPASLQAYQAFQISPIPLPIADVLASLQTGLIDSIASPPIGAIALQWHTQVEHAIDLPLLYVYGLFALAEKPFARLSAEEQAIVEEELSAAVREVDATARDDHTKAKSVLTAQGIQWAVPSSPEQAEWQQLADAASQQMVDEGYLSSAAYQRILGLLKEYRTQVSASGR
ncbi:MAG: TRAP transporter substrate-binding protein DctP [Pseudomonadota bacterium]